MKKSEIVGILLPDDKTYSVVTVIEIMWYRERERQRNGTESRNRATQAEPVIFFFLPICKSSAIKTVSSKGVRSNGHLYGKKMNLRLNLTIYTKIIPEWIIYLKK